MSYNHGVRAKKSAGGARAIKDVPTSLICILGTADDAVATAYPLDTPTPISAASNEAYKSLGTTGTLPKALDGVRDQVGANVVIIRVAHNDDEAQMTSAMVEAVQLLRGVESVVGEKPKVLIAPGFTKTSANEANPVIVEMLSVAEGLRAMVIADGANLTTTQEIQARSHYGSKRLTIAGVNHMAWDTEADANVVTPASSRVAGLFALNDNERGPFHTPSNMLVKGIVGTEHPIQYSTNDSNSEHNLLNKNQIGATVNNGGYRYYNTDTCDITDSHNRFINAVRGGDAIDDALEAGIQWAIDKNITKSFVSDVLTSIQGYLDQKVAEGDLLPGVTAYADPEKNGVNAYAQGQVHFEFDYLIPSPAVDIQVTRYVNYDFAKGVFN